jgi:hypothetical protein
MTRQLEIITIIKNGAFARTIYGNEEKIFVPFYARGIVDETSGGNPKLVESKKAPKYFLKKKDKIVAIIIDGDKNCRKTSVWAPLSVWEGKETKVVKPKVESEVKHAEKIVEDPKEDISRPSFLEQIDLPFLDEIKDKNTEIRVRPPSGHGQIYKGPLRSLFRSKAHVLSRANNQNNVFEAFIDGNWIKIWPLEVAKKNKQPRQLVYGRNRKKA